MRVPVNLVIVLKLGLAGNDRRVHPATQMEPTPPDLDSSRAAANETALLATALLVSDHQLLQIIGRGIEGRHYTFGFEDVSPISARVIPATPSTTVVPIRVNHGQNTPLPKVDSHQIFVASSRGGQ